MKTWMDIPLVRGAARLLDLGGTLGRRGARDDNEAAARAMAAAWSSLGFGLQHVVGQEDSRHPTAHMESSANVLVDLSPPERQQLQDLALALSDSDYLMKHQAR